MLQQAISISLLTVLAAAPPASSQGIRPGASISGGSTTSGPPATKVLVATPYPTNASDSAPAVQLGIAVRDRLTHSLSSSDWRVITHPEMSSNLVTYGYSGDALLGTDQARALAVALGVRIIVTTTLVKSTSGQYTATARVAGVSDPAGQVVKQSQAPGQSMADFGSKIADQLANVFKAYPDAKACHDQQVTAKDKAVAAADKAIKQVPSYGYAEYCLGLIEQGNDSTSNATLQDFKAATVGDPLSLLAINQIAVIHDRRHDSTSVVNDYQQMLVIAPTNRDLAQRAFEVFRAYHRPDAAEQVVNQQIALDPTDPDWQELKGNLCAAAAAGDQDTVKAKTEYQCAYQAFSQEYTLQPSRADSNFYQKVIFVAGSAHDSLTWARRFVQAVPSSTTPLDMETSMFVATGQADSAIAIVNRLIRIDPTDTKPVLAVSYALLHAGEDSAALQFVPLVQKSTDADLKNGYAGILMTFGDSAAQRVSDSTKHTPAVDSTLVHFGQAILDVDPPDHSRVEFGHYFIVLGEYNGLVAFSAKVRADKTCDTVKAYSTFLDALEPHVTVLTSSTNSGMSQYATAVETAITQERKAIPQFQTAFCK